MTIILDTHVWLGWLLSDSQLSSHEKDALDQTAERHEIAIAAISLWEAQMLHAKSRIDLPLPFAEWLHRASDVDVLTILPLDAEVVIELQSLPARFHGDPADRLIVATARAHGLSLATHDSAIRRSRLVNLWKP